MATIQSPQNPLSTTTTTGARPDVSSRAHQAKDIDIVRDFQRQNQLLGGSMIALAAALDAASEDQQQQKQDHNVTAVGSTSAATTSTKSSHPSSQAKPTATSTRRRRRVIDASTSDANASSDFSSFKFHPSTSSTESSYSASVSAFATYTHSPYTTRTRAASFQNVSKSTAPASSSSPSSSFSSTSVITSSPLSAASNSVSSTLLPPSCSIYHSPSAAIQKSRRSRSAVCCLSSVPLVPQTLPIEFALNAVVQNQQQQQIQQHQQKLHGQKTLPLNFLQAAPFMPSNINHEPAFYDDANSDEEETVKSEFPPSLDADLTLASTLELDSPSSTAASNSLSGPFYSSPPAFRDVDSDHKAVDDNHEKDEEEPDSTGSTFLREDESTLATEFDFGFDFTDQAILELFPLTSASHPNSHHISVTPTVTKTESASASIYVPDTTPSLDSTFSSSPPSNPVGDAASDRASILTTAASLVNEPVVVYTTATAMRAAAARPEVVQVRRPQTRPTSPEDLSADSSVPVLRVRHIVEPNVLEDRITAAAVASEVSDLGPSLSAQTLDEKFRAAVVIAAWSQTPAVYKHSHSHSHSHLQSHCTIQDKTPVKHKIQRSQDFGKGHIRTPSQPGHRLQHSHSYGAGFASIGNSPPAMMHQASASSLRVAGQNPFNHGHTASNSTIATMMSDGSSPSGRRIVPPEQMSAQDFDMLPPTIQRKYFTEGERLQFVKARVSEESQSNTSRPNSQPRPTSRQRPASPSISLATRSTHPFQFPSIPVKASAPAIAATTNESAGEFSSPKIFLTPGRILHSATLSSSLSKHRFARDAFGKSHKVSKSQSSVNIADAIRRRSRANSLESSFYASLPDKIQRRHLDVNEQVIAARHRRRAPRPPTLTSTDRLVLDWTRRRPSSNPTPPLSIYGEEGFLASPVPGRLSAARHRSSLDFDFRLREDGDEELDNPFHKRVTVLLSPTVGSESPMPSPDISGLRTVFLPSPTPSPLPPLSSLSRPLVPQNPSSTAAAISHHRPSMSTPNAVLSIKSSKTEGFMDSFHWLEEEEDFDLKLHLDDYHANLRAQLPISNSKVKPSFRRHLSINKIPFSRPLQYGGRESPAPIQVGPYGPVQNKRRSRALSLMTPRQTPIVGSDHMNSPISPMDETAHYSDPNARLKLRLYLATPEKFEEAIQYGFPAAAADPKSPALTLSLQNQSFRDSMSMVSPRTESPPPNMESLMDEKLCTFLADEESSICSGDEDDFRSSPDFEASPTPQTPSEDHDRNPSPDSAPSTITHGQKFHTISSMPNTPRVSPLTASGGSLLPILNKLQPPDFETTLASREMTLRMTLTRPDLRNDDDHMYGWKTQVTARIHSSPSSQATSRQPSPSPTLTNRKGGAYEVSSSAASTTSSSGGATERGYSPTSFVSGGLGISSHVNTASLPPGTRDSTVAKENIERQFAAFDADMEQDRGMMKRIWHKVRRN